MNKKLIDFEHRLYERAISPAIDRAIERGDLEYMLPVLAKTMNILIKLKSLEKNDVDFVKR